MLTAGFASRSALGRPLSTIPETRYTMPNAISKIIGVRFIHSAR